MKLSVPLYPGDLAVSVIDLLNLWNKPFNMGGEAEIVAKLGEGDVVFIVALQVRQEQGGYNAALVMSQHGDLGWTYDDLLTRKS